MMVAARAECRKRAGRGLDRFLYLVALFPGGDDWMRGTEKLLQQAGVRRKQALAVYTILVILLVLSLTAGLLYLQRNSPSTSLIGGMAAVLILGFMLPKQVLYRMVKRYRRKLQEALPDTVDLLRSEERRVGKE